MRKLLIGFLVFPLVSSALVFEGTVKKAYGSRFEVKGLPCYVYVNHVEKERMDLVLQYGAFPDVFTEHLVMNQRDLYIGEIILGYQFGFTPASVRTEIGLESKHHILKVNESRSQMTVKSYYSVGTQDFFDNGLGYEIECQLESKAN